MERIQTLKVGTYLRNNSYRIEKVLGQGGFGITYLATDLALDMNVAIKEFFPKDYCDREDDTNNVTLGTQNTKEFIGRLKVKFLKEARNIAKLNHPGIIRIYAAFEENSTAYYVMDYIEGMSLTEMVKICGPLSCERAVDYARQVGETLSYIHSHKMNHLDVKPSNIMVRQTDDMPILIDFGLSKQYDTEGLQTSTTPTGLSHGFAPMEQYKDGGLMEFSPQTDLYSLAATLYYLLTGTIPPQAVTLMETGLSFPPSFPESLKSSIQKAMSFRRSERQGSVMDFIRDITDGGAHVSVNIPINDMDETVAMSSPIADYSGDDDTISADGTLDYIYEEESEDNKKKITIVAGAVFAIIFIIVIVCNFIPSGQGDQLAEETSEEVVDSLSDDELIEEGSPIEHTGKSDDKITASKVEKESSQERSTEVKHNDVAVNVPEAKETPQEEVRHEVDNRVFDIAEQMPSFKGNVNQWLSQNLTYPAIAAENGIQGRVIVNFVVEKDGSISNVQVVRSVDPALDREAVNTIKRMPKWHPGLNNGQPARVKFTLPVTFKLG